MQLQAMATEIVRFYMVTTAVLAQVAELWQSSFRLTEVGQAAVEKARSWTEAANAATLLSLLCSVPWSQQ